MTPFLKSVAEDIYNRFNGNLSDIAIVFPNKRAGLFFNEYLVQCSEQPIWSPRYMTISELFQESSDILIGDTILLVGKLYKEYCRHTHSNESIDHFYYWGELMIKDFDDIDKNLIDADKIFSNLCDLRSLGTANDILDEEQRTAIEHFFNNLNPEKNSEIKERFVNIWEVINDIYHSFKESLFKENIAYEGMLYRHAIENSDNFIFSCKKYVFIGFNALNRVEARLFDILMERGQALFYWDYDTTYTSAEYHEAGRFMKENLRRYSNELHDYPYNHLSKEKVIKVVSAATDSIQARYVPKFINEHLDDKEIETAVILCDEKLLEAVQHTIPPEVKNINITMGFPISHSPVYSLMSMLIELQISGYDETQKRFTLDSVHRILNHPYIIRCSDNAQRIDKEITENRMLFPAIEMLQSDNFLAKIFSRRTDNAMWFASLADIISSIADKIGKITQNEENIYEGLFNEALLKVFTQIQRFVTLLGSNELSMQQSTAGRLFMRALSAQTMPFHGEPIVGLQIMGLLETRNLDFKNIIMLSTNEGNLPKASSENSFVPYNLRRAFGMTLSEHRDSIYAYNFYRLIQRAENITLVYNSSVDSATRGECSRYILQLQANNNYTIDKKYLDCKQADSNFECKKIEKTPQMIERMLKYFSFSKNKRAHILSPTAINRYIDCPLQFYYYYLMSLRQHDDVTSELKPNEFGSIFHAAAEEFYNELTNGQRRLIEKSDLEPFIKKDALLYKYVDKAFNEVYFKNEDGKPLYDGEQYISREVLHRFLLRLIKIDADKAPFTYIGSEIPLEFIYTGSTTSDGENIELHIGGIADRIDLKDGILNIIDYKTGKSEEKNATMEKIFTHNGKTMGYILQSMLYSFAAVDSGMCKQVVPSLVYIHKKEHAKYNDFIVKIENKPIESIDDYRTEYMQYLKSCFDEIFNIDVPFSPTDDKSRCEWCAYKQICNR
ncbi:MAG: PD-(D/E)XK nuclease family protein [Bacteroidaceae bacterium]|nr:PD-(D/E)XK nuclease family protein [Bacteroidaceae bacterium]